MLPMLGISTLTGYISQFITMSPNFECNNRLDEVCLLFSINQSFFLFLSLFISIHILKKS